MSATERKTTFEIVFDGRLVAGRNAADVERNFGTRFGESAAKAVFSQTPITLKKGLTRQQAVKFQQALEQIGMSVMLLASAPEDVELSLAEPVPATPEEKTPADRSPDTPKFGELPEPRTIAPASPAAKNTYSPTELDEAFLGDVVSPPASRMYLLTLLPVTLLMLLLPLVYVGITAMSAMTVFWTLTSGWRWFFSFDTSPYAMLVGFTALLVGSVLLTLFLLRPLLARSEKGPNPVRLDPKREPALFHLVEQITEAIGAPMPNEILVNTDVNASARLTHGVMSKTLTLTIGLPLLYGTNVQTVAGILAHEFGHFTQRWGMRSTYLVHQINYWFYRQVHERDSWDKFVDDLLEREIAILQLGAILAQFGSLLVRILLSMLAFLASLFSFSLSRQMEFDADRYEIALVGSDEYSKTAETLRVLGTAHQLALDDLAAALDSERMADNLPKLAAIKAGKFSQTDRRRIVADIEEINTSVFDTHPTDQARIKRAIEMKLPAQFRHDGPAEKLLSEIERLSKLATLQWYRSHGLDIEPEDLVPLAEIEAESDNLTRANKARSDFFGAIDRLPQYLPLLSSKKLEALSDQKLKAGFDALTNTLWEKKGDYMRARKALDMDLEYQYYYGQALFFRRAGFEIDLNAYRLTLTTDDPTLIEKKLADYRESEFKQKAELKGIAELQGKRLSVALELATRAGRADGSEVDELRRAYASIAGTHGDDRQLHESNVQIELLVQAIMDLPDNAKYVRKLKAETSSNEQLQRRIRSTLKNVPDPHLENRSLADSLPQESNELGPREPVAILRDAARIVRQLSRFAARVEGRLAEIALQSQTR